MRRTIILGIASFTLGVVVSGLLAGWAVNGGHEGLMKAFTIDTTKVADKNEPSKVGNSMSMEDMTANLQGKTGDDFDKIFVSEMIMHHQGAVDMAKLAKTNAKHQEITHMADAIINAQTKEIDQMRMWQSQWGYKDSKNDHSMHDM